MFFLLNFKLQVLKTGKQIWYGEFNIKCIYFFLILKFKLKKENIQLSRE